jgi:hypothetical protein
MNRTKLQAAIDVMVPGDASLMFGGESPQEWLARVRKERAYLPYWEEIRAEADQFLDTPIPLLTLTSFQRFFEDGSREEYERVYFERRKRMNDFVWMSMLEPEREDYRTRMLDVLWSICDEYTWCLPAHLTGSPEMKGTAGDASTIDLFAAETAFALSEIDVIAGPLLPPILRGRMREEIYRRVLRPYWCSAPFHWETATHNWAAVCAGSIGAAALYLCRGDELSKTLERVLNTMECYLQGFGDDGACTEGLEYWAYGFGFFTFFADLLYKRTNGNVNLFANDKVKSIALFPQRCFLSGNKPANFSDSLSETRLSLGLFHYLHGRFPEVELPEQSLRAACTSDHCGRWAPFVRSLVWLRPEWTGSAWQDGDFYMKDADWLISRYSTSSENYAFAAKGGHNGEPHNHNDLGHFMLYANGEPFLIDLGSGQYTRDYFGEARYSCVCNGSQGHSVPIVDGGYQLSGGQAQAQVLTFNKEEKEKGTMLEFELEIGTAYNPASLSGWVRRFQWIKKDRPVLSLKDTLILHGSELIERFIAAVPGEVVDNGTVMLKGRGQSLLIAYDSASWRAECHRGSFKGHFGEDKEFYYIDFHALDLQLSRSKIDTCFEFRFVGGE